MASVHFVLHCETHEVGERVFVVGNHPDLGAWAPEKSKVELQTTSSLYPVWCADWTPTVREKEQEKEQVHFKFVVRNAAGQFFWEEAFPGDRTLPVGFAGAESVCAEFDQAGASTKVSAKVTVPAPAPVKVHLPCQGATPAKADAHNMDSLSQRSPSFSGSEFTSQTVSSTKSKGSATSRSTRTSAIPRELADLEASSKSAPEVDGRRCWSFLRRRRPLTLEEAVAAEVAARGVLEERKAAHKAAVIAGPPAVAAAEAAVLEAERELQAREAAWQRACEGVRRATAREFGLDAAGKPQASHGPGCLVHGAKHQLEHRWIEKTGFGAAERVVAHAADQLTERMLERGSEMISERVAEHLAEQALEKAGIQAANHMVTRVFGETLRMGELAAVAGLKALRVLVPLVGMFFVFHLAQHDWHRFKEDKRMAKLLFLLAVIGDWIDIAVHMVVVCAGVVEGLSLARVDHHWLHEVEAHGMKAAIFACLAVMFGEIVSARTKRREAAKKALEPKYAVVALADP